MIQKVIKNSLNKFWYKICKLDKMLYKTWHRVIIKNKIKIYHLDQKTHKIMKTSCVLHLETLILLCLMMKVCLIYKTNQAYFNKNFLFLGKNMVNNRKKVNRKKTRKKQYYYMQFKKMKITMKNKKMKWIKYTKCYVNTIESWWKQLEINTDSVQNIYWVKINRFIDFI